MNLFLGHHLQVTRRYMAGLYSLEVNLCHLMLHHQSNELLPPVVPLVVKVAAVTSSMGNIVSLDFSTYLSASAKIENVFFKFLLLFLEQSLQRFFFQLKSIYMCLRVCY